jgi:hypothetical protein
VAKQGPLSLNEIVSKEPPLIMKKSVFATTASLAAIAAFSVAAPALAGGPHWSVNVGVGGFYPPAVYAPAPYYAAPPPPVYVQPAYPQPVYPQQVYPQPIYVRPYVYGGSYYPAPRYIAPPPYYHRGYRHYHDYHRR